AGTRPGADPGYYLPTIIAAAAGTVTLVLLLRSIPGTQARAPASAGPGGDRGAGGAGPARGEPGPGLGSQDRRRFLVTGAAAAGTAVAGGLAGRVLAEHSAVTQARAALRLPGA